MAIGIDRYKAWPRLYNAVGDATGASAAFKRLGFDEFRPPLLDDAATGQAIQNLVTRDLKDLRANDSLVLFFAGHGATVETAFHDGKLVKYGYIVPADGNAGEKESATWVRLKNWLGDVSLLLPKHILVILDACHSGIALDSVIRTRGTNLKLTESFEALRSRRSRRIISSALDDQVALDSGGPLDGHSLFTGHLIEALRGGVVSSTNNAVVTGTELGLYVQRHVSQHSSSSPQTPDFGTLEWDDRGELILEIPGGGSATDVSDLKPAKQASEWIVTAPGEIWPKGMSREAIQQAKTTPRPPVLVGAATIFSKPRPTTPPAVAPVVPSQPQQPSNIPPSTSTAAHETDRVAEQPGSGKPSVDTSDSVLGHAAKHEPPPAPAPAPSNKTTNDAPRPRPTAPVADLTPPLNSAFVAVLERHQRARMDGSSGDRVISVVQADATTSLAAWATWAAWQGNLTLVSHKTNLDEAAADVLDHVPWRRILPAARARFAQAAGISAAEVDAEIRTRDHEQRDGWIREVARTDLQTHVTGWLCAEFRGTWAHLPNFGAAPVQGTELLSALASLGAPIAVMFLDPKPSEEWFARALQCAYELAAYMPRQPLAVGVTEALAKATSTTLRSALQTILVYGQAPVGAGPGRVNPDSHTRIVERLHRALLDEPATHGLFATNTTINTHDGPVAVDLYAAGSLLAVQLDAWYHNRDPQAYHRARSSDISLQRTGTFVTRFLAEDVEHHLERVVKDIATDVSARHAVIPSSEKAP